MKDIGLFLLGILLIGSVYGQQDPWGPALQINIDGLNLISVDNQGFLFTSDSKGNILQIDKNGLTVNNFSPPRQGRLSQLEASWTVNIFTFSADLQEYRILDRFLNPIAENRIPQEHVGLAKAATLGNNNIIWILDESDISLKQFDYRRNQILQHQPLSLILGNINLDVIDIREYQNLLFINIKNEGVYVFDNQANFIRLLKLGIHQQLSFWKEKLIYLEEENIALVDYRTGIKENIPLPVPSFPESILLHKSKVVFYGNDQILIYDKDNTGLKMIR